MHCRGQAFNPGGIKEHKYSLNKFWLLVQVIKSCRPSGGRKGFLFRVFQTIVIFKNCIIFLSFWLNLHLVPLTHRNIENRKKSEIGRKKLHCIWYGQKVIFKQKTRKLDRGQHLSLPRPASAPYCAENICFCVT